VGPTPTGWVAGAQEEDYLLPRVAKIGWFLRRQAAHGGAQRRRPPGFSAPAMAAKAQGDEGREVLLGLRGRVGGEERLRDRPEIEQQWRRQ
jgi:hypothetical protein